MEIKNQEYKLPFTAIILTGGDSTKPCLRNPIPKTSVTVSLYSNSVNITVYETPDLSADMRLPNSLLASDNALGVKPSNNNKSFFELLINRDAEDTLSLPISLTFHFSDSGCPFTPTTFCFSGLIVISP